MKHSSRGHNKAVFTIVVLLTVAVVSIGLFIALGGTQTVVSWPQQSASEIVEF